MKRTHGEVQPFFAVTDMHLYLFLSRVVQRSNGMMEINSLFSLWTNTASEVSRYKEDVESARRCAADGVITIDFKKGQRHGTATRENVE